MQCDGYSCSERYGRYTLDDLIGHAYLLRRVMSETQLITGK